MTNEELGRAWATEKGVCPIKVNGRLEVGRVRWCWTTAQLGNTSPVAAGVGGAVDPLGYWSRGYDSEAEAYAELGRVVRDLNEKPVVTT